MSEKVDSKRSEAVTVDNPFMVRDWLVFIMGAAVQACYQENPLDRGRERRSKWAGYALRRFVPIVGALVDVACNHPDEFREALRGAVVVIEPMPD